MTFRAGDETVVSGNAVVVSVTVDDFANVTSAQFSLTWDPAVLQYSSAAANGSFPPSFAPFGTSSVGSGRLGFAWAGNQDETVANGTTMFSVTFNAIGAGGASSQVGFGNSPTITEVTINNGGTDITGQVVFDPGTVNVTPVPEPVHFALITAALLAGVAAARRRRGSP